MADFRIFKELPILKIIKLKKSNFAPTFRTFTFIEQLSIIVDILENII